MKLLKVIFASVIVSFIISIVLSFISYTPTSKREPDVYYSSIGESLFFAMYYITPIVLMFSIIAFILYLLMSKMKRFPHIFRVLFSIIIAGSITSLTLFLSNKSNETDDIYLIPEGYEGDIFVFYNIKGAPMVEREEGYEVHAINDKGYFVTSEPEMDYGTVTDKYYYVDEKGNRTPISDKCISLFGTGGFNRYIGDEEIDVTYTGFRLTKNQCSVEFMVEDYSSIENAEMIGDEILKDYYGNQ